MHAHGSWFGVLRQGLTAAMWTIAVFVLAEGLFFLPRASSQGTGARVPVLVELFTSDGCSSCPPADELLAQLDQEQPVATAEAIVVSEHITYWNNHKWSDPSGSEILTQRQNDYISKLHAQEPYTPQAVVDGMVQLIGSERASMLSAIAYNSRERKHPLNVSVVSVDEHSATVTIGSPDPISGELVCMAAQKQVTENVKAGENAGRTLRHVSVVYWLKQKENWSAKRAPEYTLKVPLHPHGSGEPDRLIVAVQDSHAGRVIAVAARDIS